jgi:hypothetical protein
MARRFERQEEERGKKQKSRIRVLTLAAIILAGSRR